MTARQREIATLVARGLTNREIADSLVVAEGTVANHIHDILMRLGMRSRVEIATWLGAPDQGADGADGQRRREFLAVLGHELRSPLASIRGYAQLLRRRETYDDDAVAVILAQAERLERTVSDILDASRLDLERPTLQLSRFDLCVLVRTLVEQRSVLLPRHRLRTELPDGEVSGVWDRARLEQVLDNLIDNAIKYSPDGGDVVVAVNSVGSWAELSVADDGMGVPPEARDRLFERFYRVRRPGEPVLEGLGLGLYLCRSLVEAHGGTIRVESTPGRGSTFVVRLPLGAPGREGARWSG